MIEQWREIHGKACKGKPLMLVIIDLIRTNVLCKGESCRSSRFIKLRKAGMLKGQKSASFLSDIRFKVRYIKPCW